MAEFALAINQNKFGEIGWVAARMEALADAGGEIVLLSAAAQVFEWKNGAG